MLDQHMKLLRDLGYDTSLKGAKFFVSISQQIQELVDKNNGSLNNIEQLLPEHTNNINDYINCLYLEDYAFYFECGKKSYFKEMDIFLKSKTIKDDKQLELNNKVFGEANNYDDILLNFCVYLSNNKKEKSDSKKMVKKSFF